MATELARYHVRTPLALWMTHGGLTAFCVLVLGAAIVVPDVPAVLLLLAVVLCSACVAFWHGMTAYRVGGGRNLIRFYADRVEVPGPRARKPLVFERDGLRVTVQDVKVQYRLAFTPVATVSRGKLIELECGGITRKLSTLVLDDRHDEGALLADLQRFAAGQPALGRTAHDAPLPRTDYDDRIDRELAQLE